jgi:hypothetical protein
VAVSPPIAVARTLVASALAAYIVFGPFYRQVLHGHNEWLRPWVMFSGAGLDATQVEYRSRGSDGHESVLDRYAILASTGAPTRTLSKVTDAKAAKRVGQMLCRKLGEGADVRVYLRVATRNGWKRELSGEENLCELPTQTSMSTFRTLPARPQATSDADAVPAPAPAPDEDGDTP